LDYKFVDIQSYNTKDYTICYGNQVPYEILNEIKKTEFKIKKDVKNTNNYNKVYSIIKYFYSYFVVLS
jgi:hypothetical protein